MSMRELYTLELMRLVDELSALEGFYIDQFYELERNRFRIRISRKGEKANIQCILPYSINRTSTIEVREEATNFSIAARKRMAGFRISGVEQFNNDRIILIRAEKAGSGINIIFEMFGKGNMIVTDSKMRILLAYQVHEFRDRAVKPGSTYVQPKNLSNPLDRESIEKTINAMLSEKGDAKALSYMVKRLAIGSIYVEEAFARTQLSNAVKTGALTQKEQELLLLELIGIIDECVKNPRFLAFEKEGEKVDFALCDLKRYYGLQKAEFDTLEGMLDYFYENVRLSQEAKNEEEEKTRSSIEKQKQILEEIDNEIEYNKNSGNWIMNHMREVNALIERARAVRNPTREELQPLSDRIEILSINTKSKNVKIRPKD